MEKENATLRPFGTKDKIGYAMGDFGCNMSFALNSYIQTFYLYYIGLDPLIIAAIILILKIWDGINDPIMGAIMDIVKPGKKGKFKTYIFYGSFILLFSGALCFLDTAEAPVWVQTVVFLLGYLIWDFSYTLVNVPYGSLNSAITADPVERSQLSTYRSLGSIIANVAVMIALPFVMYEKYYEMGVEMQRMLGGRMFPIAIGMGIVGFFAFQLLIQWTVERVKTDQQAQPDAEKTSTPKVNYFKALKAFFTNVPAVAITLCAMLSLIMTSGLSVANTVVYASYFKAPELSGISMAITMIPMFGIIPFVKPLVKKFGNRNICMYPLILSIIGSILMIVLPLSTDMGGLIIWALLSALVGAGYTTFTLVGWAMVSECIDYQEYNTGERTEGIVYATYSLGRKLAQGFGASLILVLLVAVGYKSYQGENQIFEVANNVRMLIGAIYLVCVLLIFLLLKFCYKLTPQKIEEINIKLGRFANKEAANEEVAVVNSNDVEDIHAEQPIEELKVEEE